MATQLIQKRNVLVLGKTGAGKSTVANKILGQDRFEVTSSLSSQTNRAEYGEVKLPDGSDRKVDYTFKVIDTVGLFDTKKEGNEKVMKDTKDYLISNIPEGVNLVVFVFRKARFTTEEKETFEYIIKNFEKEIRDISALVMTHYDSLNDEGREKEIQEFKLNPLTSSIARFMGKGIYAVGFPDTRGMKENMRRAMKEDMEEDAEKLRAVVRRAKENRLSKDMFEKTFWEKVKQCFIL